MSDTTGANITVEMDNLPAVVGQPSDEPVLDLSALRLEAGHLGDVLAHMKAWVEWRLSKG